MILLQDDYSTHPRGSIIADLCPLPTAPPCHDLRTHLRSGFLPLRRDSFKTLPSNMHQQRRALCTLRQTPRCQDTLSSYCTTPFFVSHCSASRIHEPYVVCRVRLIADCANGRRRILLFSTDLLCQAVPLRANTRRILAFTIESRIRTEMVSRSRHFWILANHTR